MTRKMRNNLNLF